eukprot:3462027-Karenia_brevis.AAC.1
MYAAITTVCFVHGVLSAAKTLALTTAESSAKTAGAHLSGTITTFLLNKYWGSTPMHAAEPTKFDLLLQIPAAVRSLQNTQ